MRILSASVAAGLCLACAAPANAAWHVAQSKHFIIYADESAADLGKFAAKLEKFDKAARLVRNMPDYTVGDGNRLTVYVLKDTTALRRLIGDKSGFVAGIYYGRASGPIAFVPRSTAESEGIDPQTVFFHEYAHHIMLQDLDRPYPQWLVEGFAEFMSTAGMRTDGSAVIGLPAKHRGYGLWLGRQLPVSTLLAGNYGKLSQDEWESIYGRGWLLTHYLFFEPSRKGQLNAYLAALANGTPAIDAAHNAFGDLRKLETEIDGYMMRSRLDGVRVAADKLVVAPADVRPLSPGAAMVLPLRMQSNNGVSDKTAEPLAGRIRAVASAYPADELVNLTLAEAELDAGHSEAAAAAAAKALAVNPRSTEAMILEGRATLKRVGKSGDPKLLEEGRSWFLKANKIDPEDPEPLMEFYYSFNREGKAPTKNAVAALHYASNLAPQDDGLRMTSALQYLEDGEIKQARTTLAPIAYNPHGGKAAEAARTMIAKIDSGDAKAALAAAEQAQSDDGETSRQ